MSYLFGLGHFNGNVEDLEYDFTVNQGSGYRYYGSIEAPLYEKALELSYSDPKRLKAIVEKYKKLPDSARTDEKLEHFMNVFLESVK